MKKLKILHCSDIHFDTPFSELPKELGEIRREEIKECFSTIINLVSSHNIDIFILAGDLFDNITIKKSTLIFIQNEISKVKNTKIFIAAGNHDPYNEQSFYKMIDWGNNVHIFSNELEEVVIPELGVVIYGISFSENYMRKSMLKEFKLNDRYKDLISIMILHGTISNEHDKQEYNPITLDEIANSKVDYLALGHIHKYSGIKRINDTHYAYSGCLEGRGFDELGEKGVIIGEIGKQYVDLNFVSTSKRKNYEIIIDVSKCITNEEIKNKILNEVLTKDSKKNLYKIVLVGKTLENIKINEGLIESLLKERFFFIKIINKTKLKIDLNGINDEFSLRGIFINKMNEKLKYCSEEEKDIVELAFKIGLQELNDEEVNLCDYKED